MITGIEAAEVIADYLKLRCNTCDEGDAANIIHLLHEHGVQFMIPDTNAPDSNEFRAIAKTIADYNALVSKAEFILGSSLHNTYVAEEKFARLCVGRRCPAGTTTSARWRRRAPRSSPRCSSRASRRSRCSRRKHCCKSSSAMKRSCGEGDAASTGREHRASGARATQGEVRTNRRRS